MLFPAATDIAVYGNCVSGATGGLPPVIPGTTWAGYFDGDVNINGQLFVNGIWTASDQMFKTNVDSIPNSLTIIKQLKPKTYFMDTVNRLKAIDKTLAELKKVIEEPSPGGPGAAHIPN